MTFMLRTGECALADFPGLRRRPRPTTFGIAALIGSSAAAAARLFCRQPRQRHSRHTSHTRQSERGEGVRAMCYRWRLHGCMLARSVAHAFLPIPFQPGPGSPKVYKNLKERQMSQFLLILVMDICEKWPVPYLAERVSNE